MAERVNKFKNMYKSRAEATLTDDIADQLYEEEDKSDKNSSQELHSPENNNSEEKSTPLEPVIEPETSNYNESVAISPVSSTKSQKGKRKAGRPKKTSEETCMFNFRISESTKQMVSIASAANGRTMTEYLERLIADDYESNKEYYDTVKERLQR